MDRIAAIHDKVNSICDIKVLLCADFKQVLGQRGSKGPAPPAKLTAHQTQIVKALTEAHGNDVEVSVRIGFWL